MKVFEKLNELKGTSLTIEEFEKYETCPTEFAKKLGISSASQEKIDMIAVRKCSGECNSLCIYRFLNSEM